LGKKYAGEMLANSAVSHCNRHLCRW